MRTHLHVAAVTAVLLFALPAMAGTQVLGAEIGVTTLDQLKQELSKKTKVEAVGENKFTGGPMLKTGGDSYEIRGLNVVLYIFDDQKKLAGVIMDMDKARFDAVFDALNGKYKLTSQKKPFVGDHYARFKPTDSVVELDAPHMGFNMEVRYIRNDLMQKFNVQSEAEAAAKKKSEASKF